MKISSTALSLAVFSVSVTHGFIVRIPKPTSVVLQERYWNGNYQQHSGAVAQWDRGDRYDRDDQTEWSYDPSQGSDWHGGIAAIPNEPRRGTDRYDYPARRVERYDDPSRASNGLSQEMKPARVRSDDYERKTKEMERETERYRRATQGHRRTEEKERETEKYRRTTDMNRYPTQGTDAERTPTTNTQFTSKLLANYGLTPESEQEYRRLKINLNHALEVGDEFDVRFYRTALEDFLKHYEENVH